MIDSELLNAWTTTEDAQTTPAATTTANQNPETKRRGIFGHFSERLIQIETVDEFLSGRRRLGDIRLEKGFVFFFDRSWCLNRS
jgi:hypothetical protein